jgi:hypothetical protein
VSVIKKFLGMTIFKLVQQVDEEELEEEEGLMEEPMDEEFEEFAEEELEEEFPEEEESWEEEFEELEEEEAA